MINIKRVKDMVCDYWNKTFAPSCENYANVEKIGPSDLIIQWMYFDDKSLNLKVVLTTKFNDDLLFIINDDEKTTEMSVYNKKHTLQII